MIRIASQSEFDSATYSASVVLRAMLVYNFDSNEGDSPQKEWYTLIYF